MIFAINSKKAKVYLEIKLSTPRFFEKNVSVENFEIRLVRMRANNYIVKDQNLSLKRKQTCKNPIIECKFSRVTTPEANSQINVEIQNFNNDIFLSP